MARRCHYYAFTIALECDVDRDQLEAIRNVLERANFLLKGYF